MSCFDLVINISNGDLVCSIYDKKGAFNFRIVNFPDLPGNNPTAQQYIHLSADKIKPGLPYL